MKNKLITAVLTLSLLSPVAIAQANNDAPVLAILDTAIDTSLPEFQNKIVGEVCILQWDLCPNGTNFQEGAGSASMSSDLIVKNGFDHGTMMASAAVRTNSNIKILFIKIIAHTSTGLRKPAGETTISSALAWVSENASRYNIKAVSISQGSSGLHISSREQYCPTFPRTVTAVQNLMSANIPVFSAAGNARDYSRIDWPSCISEVVSIGAVDQINEIASYSNNDNLLLDFFAKGNMPLTGPNNIVKNTAGTSGATQVAAATYLSAIDNFGYSGQKMIDYLKSISTKTVGRQGTFNKLMTIINTSSSPVIAKTNEQIALEKAQADSLAAKILADSLAAKKALVKIQVDIAIAAAELQYANELKAAQDKLEATKALWMAKLNV
jgi:hypothetical protein